MNREEFLAKLFGLYATTFSKGNATNWTEAYKQVLADNIDYDKLYDYMLKNYSGAAAPSPAFLSKNAVKLPDPFESKGKKYPEWETVLADKNGITYEFGLNCSFQEFIDFRRKDGFTNFRYANQEVRAY